MGNSIKKIGIKKMNSEPPPSEPSPPKQQFESVETFRFLDPFPEETNNGLCLNEVYFPEEVVMMILSYVEPKQLLRASEVCKTWNNIIKSGAFWAHIYHRKCHKKPKKLPWYVYYCYFSTNYFDQNLIKNGNGQNKFEYWTINKNYADEFRIEDPPCGADPLPADVPEFNGKTSCFATSYYECNKQQEISFERNRLMQLIFYKYKPHIYVSEWMAGRFDCACMYNLWCYLYGKTERKPKEKQPTCGGIEPMYDVRFSSDDEDEEVRYDDDDEEARFDDENEVRYDVDEDEEFREDHLHVQHATRTVAQWAGREWSKVELLVKDYPAGVYKIVFQHEGRDTQFWKGHYGSKMAGGVVKILFDSIEPVEEMPAL